MGRERPRLRTLLQLVAQAHPELDDPAAAIAAGLIVVDGVPATNPRSLVRATAAVALARKPRMRGETKLRAALDAFAVDVRGRVALDVGAAAGGFTGVLLERGARRVYAVDAGHGQLLGSLRQDLRVVNLERTNVGDLEPRTVPEPIDVVTIDLSYLALARAVPQLEQVSIARGADAVALVKPQFELGLAHPPADEATLRTAVDRAAAAFERSRWTVEDAIESPTRGSRGAIEYLLHAHREKDRAS